MPVTLELALILICQQGHPDYQPPEPRLRGTLRCSGSDMLNNLVSLFAAAFQKLHPEAAVNIDGRGHRFEPLRALASGDIGLEPSSQESAPATLERFEKEHGWRPVCVAIGWNALAAFVHKDNPLEEISLNQLDAIFSKSRQRGLKEDLASWGQLGLKGEWAGRPIAVFGRNSASGTYGLFKRLALKGGDYKDSVKEMPGSASVVEGVSKERGAIGYSGIGYGTDGVKALRLKSDPAGEAIDATETNVRSGAYPLSHRFHLHFAPGSARSMNPLVREFLRFVLSREGQALVAKDGYTPLSPAQSATERAKIK